MSNPDTIPQWQTIEQIQAEHRVAHNWCQACALLAYMAAEPPVDGYVRLATAVMQVRDFIALHMKAKRRSDVSGRKVLALIDEALA